MTTRLPSAAGTLKVAIARGLRSRRIAALRNSQERISGLGGAPKNRLVPRFAALLGAALSLSCSLGDGSGYVHSDRLIAPTCFDRTYDLHPTFFASNPYRQTQMIRVQRGNDLEENSDGVEILVDDTPKVRSELGQPLSVALPPQVTPPGVPITPQANPASVHLTLYLHETCHGENIALYGVDGTITFEHLFNGDRNEERAENKLTQAHFDIQVGDPRDMPPQGGAIPPGKLSHMVGAFRFYFQRGQPGQPFPLKTLQSGGIATHRSIKAERPLGRLRSFRRKPVPCAGGLRSEFRRKTCAYARVYGERTRCCQGTIY